VTDKFCRNCGAENPEGTNFCGACGKPLSQEAATQGEYKQQAAVPVAIQPKKKRGCFKNAILGCGGLILLIIIIAAIGAAFGGGSSGNKPAASVPAPNQSSGGQPTATSVPVSNPVVSGPLLDVAGTGRMTTPVFRADADWTVKYGMACQSDTSNFSVTTYHADNSYGDLLENLVTRQINKTQYIHDSGEWYLVVEGDCPWRVSVAGQGQPASFKPNQGQVLLDTSGTGTQSTQRFTATGNWEIHYSFACQADTANFSITSYQGDGTYGDLLENLVTKNLDKTQYIHKSGTWYLKIEGDCPWRVTVHG
jgi:zinc-ribbon domain